MSTTEEARIVSRDEVADIIAERMKRCPKYYVVVKTKEYEPGLFGPFLVREFAEQCAMEAARRDDVLSAKIEEEKPEGSDALITVRMSE